MVNGFRCTFLVASSEMDNKLFLGVCFKDDHTGLATSFGIALHSSVILQKRGNRTLAHELVHFLTQEGYRHGENRFDQKQENEEHLSDPGHLMGAGEIWRSKKHYRLYAPYGTHGNLKDQEVLLWNGKTTSLIELIFKGGDSYIERDENSTLKIGILCARPFSLKDLTGEERDSMRPYTNRLFLNGTGPLVENFDCSVKEIQPGIKPFIKGTNQDNEYVVDPDRNAQFKSPFVCKSLGYKVAKHNEQDALIQREKPPAARGPAKLRGLTLRVRLRPGNRKSHRSLIRKAQ